MDNSHRKFIIITASIVLHAITLFVILVLYHEPSHDQFTDFDPSKAIDVTETIFYDPSDANSSSPSQPEHSVFDEWGQLNPRASTLGSSMEMPDGPIGVEMPGNANESEDGTTDTDEDSDDESQAETVNGNSLEFAPKVNFEAHSPLVSSEPLGESRNEDNFSIRSSTSLPAFAQGFGGQAEANGEGATSVTDQNKTSSTTTKATSKSKARKALAGITQGYLQQLKDEGENLIKTLGGDPNKKPTAEQLKYERYLAKIQWCLQNAHSINQDKCQLHEQIDAAMRIYFVLNREGKMTGFKIMQSSGKAYVDQYISSLFQFASSSFPPLPAYVKEDHLPLTYTVMVNWNTGSTGFSRY